jgi:hypothetical protein
VCVGGGGGQRTKVFVAIVPNWLNCRDVSPNLRAALPSESQIQFLSCLMLGEPSTDLLGHCSST